VRDEVIGTETVDLGLCGEQQITVKFSGEKIIFELVTITLCNVAGTIVESRSYDSKMVRSGRAFYDMTLWQQFCDQAQNLGIYVGGDSSGANFGITYAGYLPGTWDLSYQTPSDNSQIPISCPTCGGSSFIPDSTPYDSGFADIPGASEASTASALSRGRDFSKPVNLRIEINSSSWASIIDDLRLNPSFIYDGAWSTFSCNLTVDEVTKILQGVLNATDFDNFRTSISQYPSGTVIFISVNDPGYGGRNYTLVYVVN